MENHTNESNGLGGQQPPEQTSTRARPFEAIGSALRRGAEDARPAAEGALPRLKSVLNSAVYWTAYGLSYGAIFQWTLAKAGSLEGVRKGRSTAEQCLERLKAARNAKNANRTASTPLLGSPPQEAQAGPA
jgi:hypothetical protein